MCGRDCRGRWGPRIFVTWYSGLLPAIGPESENGIETPQPEISLEGIPLRRAERMSKDTSLRRPSSVVDQLARSSGESVAGHSW